MSGGDHGGEHRPDGGVRPTDGPVAPVDASSGPGGVPTKPGEVPAKPIPSDRLAYVDVMRTVAVARVVVNHALPWPWLKWFESLPVMFFVSGTLVGRSLRTRSAWAVFVGRFKRLAMPTGVYLVFAAVCSLTNWLPGTTTHLWYIWTFLLFCALSVPFRAAIRWSVMGTMAIFAVLVVVATLFAPTETGVGVAYAMSWVAGMAWADDDCAIPSTRLLVATVVAGFSVAAVSVWWRIGINATTSPSAMGISMAALGGAWLATGMLLRHQLDASMHVRVLGPFIRYLNRRLLTIYLWHLPTTLIAQRWAGDLGLSPAWSVPFVLAVTILLTAVATVAFGGLEDRASASSKAVKARAEQAAAKPGSSGG